MIHKIPIVNWPKHAGIFKIVQLYVDDKPFLSYGGISVGYSQIFREFLDSAGIGYKRNSQKKEQILPVGDDYLLAGMGYSGILSGAKPAIELGNRGSRTAFFDLETKSTFYDLGIDMRHLTEIEKLEPDWEFQF